MMAQSKAYRNWRFEQTFVQLYSLDLALKKTYLLPRITLDNKGNKKMRWRRPSSMSNHLFKNNLNQGFTLIELLIVIAIILILIAIALPNFLEAQLRATTTKAAANLKSIETAAMEHMLQYGYLYADYNDSLNLMFETRMKGNHLGPCSNRSPGIPKSGGLNWIDGGTLPPDHYGKDIHCPLTTPIAYIDASQFMDPFSDGTIPIGLETKHGNFGKFKDVIAYSVYMSAGPDRVAGDWLTRTPYSPTNGTRSRGEMWRIVQLVPDIAKLHGYSPLNTN